MVLKERPYGTPERTATVAVIVWAYVERGSLPDAERFLLDLLEEDLHRGASAGTAAQTHIALLVDLYRSWVPRPRYAEAEALLKEVLARQRRTRNAADNSVRRNVNQLASVYAAQNKFHEAEELLTPLVHDPLVAKVVAGGRPALEQYPTILASMDLLAQVYGKQGKSFATDALFSSVSKLMDGLPVAGSDKQNLATPLSRMALTARN
jgi:tetratricopeptide (TPR) repeat protein